MPSLRGGTATRQLLQLAKPSRQSFPPASSRPSICNACLHKLRQRRFSSSSSSVGAKDRADAHAPPPNSVAVIGGGLTGLTTAYYLARFLPATSRITLYERADRLGGWVHTRRVKVDVAGTRGTVQFEHGPRTLRSLRMVHSDFDDVVMYDLIGKLGIKMQPVDPAVSNKRYIRFGGTMNTVPGGAGAASSVNELLRIAEQPAFRDISFPLAGLSFLASYLRQRLLVALGRRPGPSDDISIGEFYSRALGQKAVVDNALSAIFHGIYGGDVDQLSFRALRPRLWARFFLPGVGRGRRLMVAKDRYLMEELGSLPSVIEGAQEVPPFGLFYPRGGMGSLVEALAGKLREFENVEIRTGEPVIEVSYDQKADQVKVTTEKETRSHAKVISTTTAKALSSMAGAALPALADTHAVSIMAVNLWFPGEPHRLPGLGYLVPRGEQDNLEGLLGVFFDGNVMPPAFGSDEPAGAKYFVLLGGHYWDKLAPDEMPTPADGVLMARNVLWRHLGIPVDAPAHAEAYLARECIPQHRVGHVDVMRAAREQLQANFAGRLAVAGNSYDGVGVAASLRSGYEVADQTAHQTTSSRQGTVGDTGLDRFAHPLVDAAGVAEAEAAELVHPAVKIRYQVDWGRTIRNIVVPPTPGNKKD